MISYQVSEEGKKILAENSEVCELYCGIPVDSLHKLLLEQYATYCLWIRAISISRFSTDVRFLDNCF